MDKFKTHDDYFNLRPELTRTFQRYKTAKTKSGKTRNLNKLTRLEEKLRKTANRRLRALRESDLELDTAARLEQLISYQARARKYLSKPKTPEQIFQYAQAEAQFLAKEMSTVSGAKKGLDEIKERFEKGGYKFESFQDFKDFYLWRQENPVQEFFNLFPLSPPELREEVSAVAYDLFNRGEKERQILEDYFKAWESFKKSKGEVGISLGELRDKIFELYEKQEKRRR